MKPKPRCRPEDRPIDLVPAAASDNRARRPARARMLGGAALAIWAATAGGCSLSVPISGLETDGTATGSIDRTVALLAPALDVEDVRRAKAAMAVSLDPQGNGTRAGWQNPQSGAHGGFAADGSPFTDHDRVCRRFSGDVVPASGNERRLSGSACRESDGTWAVQAGASRA